MMRFLLDQISNIYLLTQSLAKSEKSIILGNLDFPAKILSLWSIEIQKVFVSKELQSFVRQLSFKMFGSIPKGNLVTFLPISWLDVAFKLFSLAVKFY